MSGTVTIRNAMERTNRLKTLLRLTLAVVAALAVFTTASAQLKPQTTLSAEAAAELDALLPSILDKTFKGEL